MNGRRITEWLETKGASWLPLLIVLAGAVLRVVVWGQNHALFIDEANLARNLCERDLFDFFRPLDHDQYAPPLFMLVQKSSVLLLGQQEYALRLFPLLCSLLALLLFYRIGGQLIENPWVLVATVWIFSFNDIFLRYAAEGKPYACDLAVALGLVALGLRNSGRQISFALAGLLGAVAIWLSMPSVFVLFGLGLYWFYQTSRAGGERRILIALAGTVSAWLLSFGAYYWFLLQPSMAVTPLVSYHQPWFFPLLPHSEAEWAQAGALLMTFPYYTAGFTVLAQLTGIAGILTGLLLLFRTRKELFLLIAAPVLVCVLASGFRQYSLIPRMLVWAFPLALLVQATGWQAWWGQGNRYLRILWVVLWGATAGLHTGWRYVAEPLVIEEVRSVLETIREDFRPDDILYVYHEAWPAVTYYRECHKAREQYAFGDRMIHGEWNEHPGLDKLQLQPGRPQRIWLVYSHIVSDESRNAMEADLNVIGAFARQERVVEMPGAWGYLYVF